MLGPVELCIDERQVPLPGSRLRGVVGVLALHANRVVAAERLLQAVWGPAPPKTARNSLQGQASRLRRLLAASGESDRLVFREPGYLLRVEAGELDLGEFKRLADEGRGRLDQAVDHLTAALTLIREVGYRGVEAETLRLLAAVHRDAGRHNQALELAQAAVALARDTGDRQYETDALDTLATIHQRLARPDRARAHASRALVMAREAGLQLLEGQALATLAGIDLDQGEPDQARQHAEQALELHRATGHRLGQARALVTLGRALRDSGGAEAALPCWREALALFTEAGSPEADQIRALLRAARHRPNAVGGPARTNR